MKLNHKKHPGKTILLSAAALAAAGVLFCGGIKVGAAGAGAGSVSDPIITKSYLDLRLNEVTEGNLSFAAVEVAAGKIFSPSEGTIFMVYSGSGTVSGTGGLINLTGGELFRDGNTMVKYNLFLAPEETCGLKVSSDAVIYVQGSYSIR